MTNQTKINDVAHGEVISQSARHSLASLSSLSLHRLTGSSWKPEVVAGEDINSKRTCWNYTFAINIMDDVYWDMLVYIFSYFVI